MTDERLRDGSPESEPHVMPMCPMGETCMRMMENPPSRYLMFVPGILFLLVGVLIVVEPRILIWLIATASILMGIAMLGCAYFMRGVGSRLMRAHR